MNKACAVSTPYPYNIPLKVNESHIASISVWWCNISVLFSIQKFVMVFSLYTISGPTNVILYESGNIIYFLISVITVSGLLFFGRPHLLAKKI